MPTRSYGCCIVVRGLDRISGVQMLDENTVKVGSAIVPVELDVLCESVPDADAPDTDMIGIGCLHVQRDAAGSKYCIALRAGHA